MGGSSGSGGGGGGTSSGGGGMGVDWVALGTKIHEDSLESINLFRDMEKELYARERRKKLDTEARRQFKRTAEQRDRSQNLSALSYLSRQRAMAGQKAKAMSFDDAIGQAIRSY